MVGIGRAYGHGGQGSMGVGYWAMGMDTDGWILSGYATYHCYRRAGGSGYGGHSGYGGW